MSESQNVQVATSSSTLVKVAAASVIVLSLVGVGVMLGWIPAKSDTQEVEAHKAVTRTPARSVSAPRSTACYNCGVVEAVNLVNVKGEATGVGAIAGGVTGIAVGNQIGRGDGKKIAKVVGAVGGAVAGNEIEKHVRSTTQYQIAVRMESGAMRTFTQTDNGGLSPGARVKIAGNSVVPY